MAEPQKTAVGERSAPSETVESDHQRAGTRAWVGLAVLMLPLMLIALDNSVLALAAPAFSAGLQPTATQQLWILDVYGLFMAGFLIAMGTLGDRIGRRRLLLIGAAAFGVASVLAAYAPTAGALIAARILLGVAGAAMMPSTLGQIRALFPDPNQRSTAIGIWMGAFLVGGALGPIVGGVLLEHFWWGSVFLLGAPVMALLMLTGGWLLPETRDPQPGRVDLTSVVLSLAAMLLLVYGLKRLATGAPVTATGALVVGAVAAVAFIRRQRRLSYPLLDLALVSRSAVTAALLMLLLGQIVMNGTYFLVPQYLQSVFGHSALAAAGWMMPLIGSSLLLALTTPRLVRWCGPARLLAIGGSTAALGLGLIAAAALQLGLAILVAGSVLLAVGATPIGVVATDVVLGNSRPERAGAASSLSETSSELGAGVGIAVLGSIVAGVYRIGIADVLHRVPDPVAAAAQDTVAGAIEASNHLPADIAGPFLEQARDSFGAGIAVAGLVGVALMLAVARVAMTRLSHPSQDGTGHPDRVTHCGPPS